MEESDLSKDLDSDTINNTQCLPPCRSLHVLTQSVPTAL